MIVGDKIVTTNLLVGWQLTAVSVIAIEKHDYVWMFLRRYGRDRLYVAHAHMDVYTDESGEIVMARCTGRVAKRDRGIVWAPAWIEREVDLLRVNVGLMTLDTSHRGF